MQTGSMRALSSAAVLGLFAVTVGAQEAGRVFTPAELKWVASPGAQGMETLDLLGDSAQPGSVVYRVRSPPNYCIQAHVHPDERTYTVISGVWYVGWGAQFDEAKLKPLPAGSFCTEPANVPHFVMTRGEGAVVQITATGPITRPQFLDPAHK